MKESHIFACFLSLASSDRHNTFHFLWKLKINYSTQIKTKEKKEERVSKKTILVYLASCGVSSSLWKHVPTACVLSPSIPAPPLCDLSEKQSEKQIRPQKKITLMQSDVILATAWFLFKSICVDVCTRVCVYVCLCVGVCYMYTEVGGQPQESVLSSYHVGFRIELRSSGLSASALTYWTIASPNLSLVFWKQSPFSRNLMNS